TAWPIPRAAPPCNPPAPDHLPLPPAVAARRRRWRALPCRAKMLGAPDDFRAVGQAMDANALKIEAARAALAHVRDGMRLGIGTGGTGSEDNASVDEEDGGGMAERGLAVVERRAVFMGELGEGGLTDVLTADRVCALDGAGEVDCGCG